MLLYKPIDFISKSHYMANGLTAIRRNICKECLRNFMEMDWEISEKHQTPFKADGNFNVHLLKYCKVLYNI